jgi:glycosyltransferase involved in cell wall biosynthesis
MPKVAHLTTVHKPRDIRIFIKEATTLAANGYAVTVICCAPSSFEERGVRVRAIALAKNRMERMTATAFRALAAALSERADLYHFHDPELIPIGLVLKLCGKRVIYDVHEDAAKDVADKPYLPAWIKPLLRAVVAMVEAVAAQFFDAVVAATPTLAAKFPAAKTTLIRNVPLLDEMRVPNDRPFRERARRVVYVGGLAPFNGVEPMIRSMAELPAASDIRLTLGGRSNSHAGELAMRALPGFDRVDFHGWVDRARVAEFFADARAGLVIYQPTPNVIDSEPNKFFEVLSAGLPLIASDLPHWRRFIEKYSCGLVVPPNDPSAIAAAIRELVDNPERAERMGQRGRAVVVDHYNWEAESRRLLDLYGELLPDTRPAVTARIAPRN